MTWKAMSAGRTWDVVDFWADVTWPQRPAQVQQLGVQVGWTPDDDELMQNEVDGLSEPGVPIASMPTGETASFNFWTTDVVRESTPESDAFLDDQYALLVREGNARWGAATLSDDDRPTAQWDHDGGSRVVASRGAHAVTVDFVTPQYASVLRELGE